MKISEKEQIIRGYLNYLITFYTFKIESNEYENVEDELKTFLKKLNEFKDYLEKTDNENK